MSLLVVIFFMIAKVFFAWEKYFKIGLRLVISHENWYSMNAPNTAF